VDSTSESYFVVERNNMIFNSSKWHDAKLGKVIWDDLLDYGSLDSGNILRRLLRDIQRLKKYLGHGGVLTRLFACVRRRKCIGATNCPFLGDLFGN
jgi:hypothetical protein